MCFDIYSAEGEERWRSALTAVPAHMSWRNTECRRNKQGWCSVSSTSLKASWDSYEAAADDNLRLLAHLGDVQKVDLQEETQGASRNLVGRSADGIAYLAADRQPVFVLALGRDKQDEDRNISLLHFMKGFS